MCQPVELPNNNHVALPDLAEDALKLWPLSMESGNLLAEDFLTSSFLRRFELKLQFLIQSRNTGVADLHDFILLTELQNSLH